MRQRFSCAKCNPLSGDGVSSTFPRRSGLSNQAILARRVPPMGQAVLGHGRRNRTRQPSQGRVIMSLSSLSIRLLTALVLAAPVAACEIFEGRQSVAAYADDSTISNSIRARFLEDPVVNFGDVGVTTLNGNVRLTGRVNSERERQRAAQIAREVKGVRGVNNEIAVR
jgi:hyperosmotically inducible protein